MKNKVITYGFLSLLLTSINPIVAMETEIILSNRTSPQISPKTSPHSSQPNSPRKNILETLAKPTPIKDLFEMSDKQYVCIASDGNLNTNNALNKQERMALGNCYNGYITNNNNKYFIKVTHKCSYYNPIELEESEQFCIEAHITIEQYKHVLNHFESNESPMIFGRGESNIYCYITDIQNAVLEELPYEKDNFSKNKPYAVIFDEHDNEYQCHITYNNDIHSITVNKINKTDNSIEPICSRKIPQKKESYTMLVELTSSQCVMIDKDQKLYIVSDLVTHILQKSYENGILHIRPLPPTITDQEITTNPETINQSEVLPETNTNTQNATTGTETKTDSETTEQTPEKTHNFTPNNDRKNPMHILIGGLTISAILLAVLYKYNKLPNIAELFNGVYNRVQKFSFAK